GRRSGEPFDDRVFVLCHPRRWFYGVLPAADYFRRASQAEAAAPDLSMTEAIESIRGEREDDGSWLQGHRLEGDVWFHVDVLPGQPRSEEHTSELQSRFDLVCRLLLEKKKIDTNYHGTCDRRDKSLSDGQC